VSEEEKIKKTTPEIPQEPETSSFKLILALGLAGLFSGIVIVGTYIYTLPIIEANKAEAQQKAIFKVLPECASFSTHILQDGEIIDKPNQPTGKTESETEEVHEVFAGFDANGDLIGFAIPGSEPGFQDIIGTIFGYDAVNETIIGFEVLESRETPGLGDKIFKDENFALNFKSLTVMPEIISAKPGKKTKVNEVETISVATISSKAVIRLLNKAVKLWYEPIKDMDTSSLKPPAKTETPETNIDQTEENE